LTIGERWYTIENTNERSPEVKGRTIKKHTQHMPENSLFSQNLQTKGKTFFFDVKEAKNGNRYLSITESRMKDGQKFRSTITVFPDNLHDFSQTLESLKDKVQ